MAGSEFPTDSYDFIVDEAIATFEEARKLAPEDPTVAGFLIQANLLPTDQDHAVVKDTHTLVPELIAFVGMAHALDFVALGRHDADGRTGFFQGLFRACKFHFFKTGFCKYGNFLAL